MSSVESQELTEVSTSLDDQSSLDPSTKTQDDVGTLELYQPSTSGGFPSDTVYLNVDLSKSDLLVEDEPNMAKPKRIIEEGESFLSAIDPTNDMSTSTNIPRTEAAIITEVDRSGPPPPYPDEPTYVYRDGRYVRVPQARHESNPRGPATIRDDPNRNPPPYSTFDPFLLSLFNDRKIRNQFVQKVYMILTFQLLFSFGCIGLCLYNQDVKYFVIRHSLIFLIVGTILYFTLSIMLMCCDSVRRMYPCNFFLLALFTIAMTMLTATMSCFYDTYIVLMAFGITAAITITITVLSFLPCIDITGMGIYLVIASVIIFIYGLVALILTMFGYGVVWTIYAWLVTILLCFYLMYDTQLIVGGKRLELSPQEYILGALMLYTDIMLIFIYVLEIMRGCRINCKDYICCFYYSLRPILMNFVKFS